MKTLPFAFAVSCFLLLAACGRHASETGASSAAQPSVGVHVYAVKYEQRPSLSEVVGTVRPVQHALIASKVMGSIEEMPIILGQRVRQGDLLLKISAAEIAARALQAQSQLHQARRDLERERDLFSKGASTQDTVHSLEDRQAMTEAMVHEAEAMLGYTSVRAPFDGVVTRKLANAGDLAAPGLPLLELEGLTDFQVEAGIPDSLSGGLKLGQMLRVDLSETNQDLQGTLVELSSAADPAARTVPAKVALPAVPGVRSGQFARIQVPGAPIRVMLVPESSLVRHGQIEAVFIADKDSQAVLRIVKTGALHRERREILSGLSETERIVIDPPAGLREGSKLEVLP